VGVSRTGRNGARNALRIQISGEWGTYMEHGLSSPGRIESRGNKKQVRTMATAEKIASGGDWYISLWTACKSMGTENGGVHVVSEGA
jgi:hypothetical protein